MTSKLTLRHVQGLEAFFLSAGPIAEELQSLCASSATSWVGGARPALIFKVYPFAEPICLSSLPPASALLTSTPKKPAYEAVVQGSQIPTVVSLLTSKGVPKSAIETSDQTKGKKK
jgi:translation initiation factor 1 (eIF-1/SUI1)